MSKIDAIIFDCDGVLVDSEVIFLNDEIKFLHEIGLSYSFDEYVERYMGLNTRDWLVELEGDYADAGLGEFPHGLHKEKRKRKWARILDELQPIPGARELAESFDGPICTASSSQSDRLKIKLDLTGMMKTFAPHIYSADLVKRGKPAPDLFLLAAEKLGVSPEQCLVIEDSEHGIKAGLAAGMHVVGFTGGSHATEALSQRLKDAGAHYLFESHAKISSWLGINS